MNTIPIRLLLLLASTCVWCRQIATNTTAAPAADLIFGIYGGISATINEIPCMALLRPKSLAPHCGASVITDRFLVSAAHCVFGKSPYEMVITVGTANVRGGQHYDIEKLIPHMNYVAGSNVDYDVSVIKLQRNLIFSAIVQPIQIADSVPRPGDIMQTYGFGDTETGDPSTILMKVSLRYVDTETCRELNTPIEVTNRMICAGNEVGKGICLGDSGGPLIYNGKLIGAVSWFHTSAGIGQKCGMAGYPGAFAYVPYMMDFINDALRRY